MFKLWLKYVGALLILFGGILVGNSYGVIHEHAEGTFVTTAKWRVNGWAGVDVTYGYVIGIALIVIGFVVIVLAKPEIKKC